MRDYDSFQHSKLGVLKGTVVKYHHIVMYEYVAIGDAYFATIDQTLSNSFKV